MHAKIYELMELKSGLQGALPNDFLEQCELHVDIDRSI